MTVQNVKEPPITFTASPEALQRLHDNVQSFWCGDTSTIPILDEPPSSLQFLRDFVGPSRPCVIRNAMPNKDENGEPLIKTLDELVEAHPDLMLQVDVTPDGHGDCVRRVRLDNQEAKTVQVFVQPQQRYMTLTEFFSQLRQNHKCLLVADLMAGADAGTDEETAVMDNVFDTLPLVTELVNLTMPAAASLQSPGVVYYSRQNDCLRTELGPLMKSLAVPKSIDFCEHAFGTGPPDAVNLWIGNECSVSSFHKDHYENLMVVLSGTKVFYLCPPANALLLKQQEYQSGSFVHDQADGTWKVRMDYGANATADNYGDKKVFSSHRVRWIGADPTSQVHLDADPLLSQCHVIKVEVHAGETLYIPSLWFHKVTQTCETVAVNYWYDMKFDAKWCYFDFVESLDTVGPRNPGSGSLGIANALDDAERIAQLIRDHARDIHRVVATLDSHQKLHISHPSFWWSADGSKHPDPFTIISANDIRRGTWIPRSDLTVSVSNNIDSDYFTNIDAVLNDAGNIDIGKYALEYACRLEKKGRFQLCIWPEHCLIGSPGHAMVDCIRRVLDEWSELTGRSVEWVSKGEHILTEMYSALQADVPVTKSTAFNDALHISLAKSSKLLVCGQAMSHCVNYTLRDVVSKWDPTETNRICLLIDCTSPVPGFEDAAKTFVDDMRAKGVQLKEAAQIQEWMSA
ncbi:hypothetical protein MPSEU_000548700 [Mayamaea pseudoterrestris]|nr:hypothetical protein MPSEU_000548700 [Mayamaea pseudoterrestris]